MKRASGLAMLCLLLLPSISVAQRRRTPAERRRTPAANSAQGKSTPALADARGRVADQIKILTRFLYLFGRASGSVEVIEDQARGTRVTPQETALINKNRTANWAILSE